MLSPGLMPGEKVIAYSSSRIAHMQSVDMMPYVTALHLV